jgi:hypothetical protein
VGGREACANCASGSYTLSNGSTFCTICGPGRYCPNADREPIPCPLGTASQIFGLSTSCPPCNGGYYANQGGLAYCIRCPPGHACPSTRSEPKRCPSNILSRQTVCLDDIGIGR